jgi:hypothetical protein
MKPMQLNADPQFFIDDLFIAESNNINLCLEPPQKAGIVLAPERPWEAYRIFPSTILEDDGIYKIWYESIAHYPGKEGTVPCPRCRANNSGEKAVCVKCGWPLLDMQWMEEQLIHQCYAVSKDGVQWERPDLGLVEYAGNRKNNIVESCGVPSINPRGPSEEKFMSILQHQGSLYITVSPDGLHWKRKPHPVLPFTADTNNQIIFDPAIGKYIAFLRGFPGRRTIVRCAFNSLDEAPWPYHECRRKPDHTGTMYIENELETVMDIDKNDPLLPGLDINHLSACFYTNGVYLGFPGLFRKYPGQLNRQGRENHRYFAQGNDGTFETQLAVSRDGRTWTRPDRHPYVSTGLYGEPDGGIIMVAPGLISHGEKMYQYYGGKLTTHGIFEPVNDKPDGAIFRLVQQKDRFIAATAGIQGGWFRTPLLRHHGNRLELNIDCQGLGETCVQILDEKCKPLPGFTQDDCDPVDLNQLCQVVTWHGHHDIGSTAGKSIRLEFFMRASKLFTFRFAG